jgi:hypothetical protein
VSDFDGHTESYAAYEDESGNPLLVLSSVLFFDLLGVQGMARAPDAEQKLGELWVALREAIKQSQIDHPWSLQVSSWFTDNAVVAQPQQTSEHSESLIGGLEIVAADLLVHCWIRGFLGRGAITYGDHHISDRFVFGPALVEAVNLEKKKRWPHVVLGADAVKAEREHSAYYSQALQSTQSRCLTSDEDGVVFVDHLGVYISNSGELIPEQALRAIQTVTTRALSSLERNKEPWLKWRWAAEYHNHVLASRLVNPEPYLVALPEVRHHFADFLDPMPSTEPGSPWYIMDRVDRSSVGELGFDLLVLTCPACMRSTAAGLRQYVGATKNLHTRVVRYHLSQSPKMADSALRRNVAEMLGFASAAAIKDGSYVPTTTQAAEVHRWLLDCEIAWIECASRADALAEERKLKHQQLPPLTKL